MFDVRRGWKRKGREIVNLQRDRNYAGIADFVIFVGIDENRFFILPPHEVTQNFFVPPRGRQYSTKLKIYGFEDAWHLLDVDSALSELEPQNGVTVTFPESGHYTFENLTPITVNTTPCSSG